MSGNRYDGSDSDSDPDWTMANESRKIQRVKKTIVPETQMLETLERSEFTLLTQRAMQSKVSCPVEKILQKFCPLKKRKKSEPIAGTSKSCCEPPPSDDATPLPQNRLRPVAVPKLMATREV